MNSIIIITLSLWIIAIALYVKTGQLVYLSIPYVAFALNEVSYATTGKEFTTAKARTGLFYDVATIATKNFCVEPNFSEGYWPNGDYTISGAKAEQNKYDEIIRLLGAKPGDIILDMGCGTCSMATYFATKGIIVEGITVSDEQVNDCKKAGIKAYNKDFCKYHPEFKGRYSHLIMMGSPEHIHDGPFHFASTYEKHNRTMDKVLGYCKLYLKKDGKMFFSGLHINSKYIRTPAIYIFERMYGGTMCLNKEGYDISSAARRVGFNVQLLEDHTKDYYMATVTNKNHFGNATSMCNQGFVLPLIVSIVYPPFIYMSLYYSLGLWMWMFDGHYHTKTCTDSTTVYPQYELKSMEDRPCTLWWAVFSA